MKKITVAVICISLLLAVILVGCDKNTTEQEPPPSAVITATPGPTEESTEEPTPEPTEEPAEIVLMDIPEEEAETVSVPDYYAVVDVREDMNVPLTLGFTAYSFLDAENDMQYRAFGKVGQTADGTQGEYGFYAIEFKDVLTSLDKISEVPLGERVLIMDIGTDEILDFFVVGDEEAPPDMLEEGKNLLVYRALVFDGLTAVPVDVEAERATVMTPTDADGNQEAGQGEEQKPITPSQSGTGGTSGGSTNTGGTSGGSTNTPTTNDPNAGKTWHDAVYEDVWVVDVPASSYEEPVYEKQARSICNVCGADITDNVGSHTEAHASAGEGGGYHTEYIQVQTGTKTITVPEQGHWEQKLVREAGYY